jgi:hypothetical protein
MEPMSAAEFAAFKLWALGKAAQMNCDNAIVTGSVSRNQSHPYSDIDLEMYTPAEYGFQGFYHWNSRLVSLHIEPMEEMSAEVTDPYYQVWHRATLSDGVLIKDSSNYISSIAIISRQRYDVDKIEQAKSRLVNEIQHFVKKSFVAFECNDALSAIYYLSYFIQSVSIKLYLEKNISLGSEVLLSQTFVDHMECDLTSLAVAKRFVEEFNRGSSYKLATDESHFGGFQFSHSNLDAIISLRRILEYRRKIYGAGRFLDTIGVGAFVLYCLGRVLGNYQTFFQMLKPHPDSNKIYHSLANCAALHTNFGSRRGIETAKEICDAVIVDIIEALETADNLTFDVT